MYFSVPILQALVLVLQAVEQSLVPGLQSSRLIPSGLQLQVLTQPTANFHGSDPADAPCHPLVTGAHLNHLICSRVFLWSINLNTGAD